MGKALEIPILDETVAKVVTSIGQYLIVVESGATVVISGAAAVIAPMGICQNKPTSTTEPPSVRTIGVSKCVAGAAVAVGDKVTSDVAGKDIKSDPAAGVQSGVVGVARTAAAAEDDIFSVKLGPYEVQGA